MISSRPDEISGHPEQTARMMPVGPGKSAGTAQSRLRDARPQSQARPTETLLLAVLCAAALLLPPLPSANAAESQVKAAVSTDTVGLQEQFQLTITVTGNDSSVSEPPRLTRLRGARIVSGPSVSTQYQWINGESSSSRTFVYILLPEQVGEFTIDPIEVRVGQVSLRTQPIRVKVTPESQNRPAPTRNPRFFDPFQDEDPRRQQGVASDEVFVNAELDRSSAYPGQQITLSYHLYTQVSVTGIQLQDSPPLSGFWVEDLEVPTNQAGTRRVVEGREYREYVVKKQALFPNAAGKLRIPSATFAISARNVGGLFGMLGPSETLLRKTREVTVEVQPLPTQGRPAGFKGAVGGFSINSSVDKSEIAAGSAVTLLVRLSGRGNLKVQPDIELPPLADLTVYSAKQSQNLKSVEGDQLGGERSWEYVLVPRVPGRFRIPALEFAYFDPERGRYDTAATIPIELSVARGSDAGAGSGAPAGLQKESVTRQGSDINFIKLTSSGIDGPEATPFRGAAFWLLLGLPVLANAVAIAFRRRRMREAGNVLLLRRRKARSVALARLRKAAKQAPKSFYDEAAAALAVYLADRFNLPGIALTSDGLARELAAKHVPGDVVAEVAACLGECDFGRFVSASSDLQRRKALETRIRNVIDSLERAEA